MLQDLWLSANDHSLLPETLEAEYDSTEEPIADRHDDANSSDNGEVHLPQTDRENQLSCCSAVTSCNCTATAQQLNCVSEIEETVPCETNCLNICDSGLDATRRSSDDRPLTVDHESLFEKLCHEINSTNDAVSAALLSGRLHCILKFFNAECLSDSAPVFPFHILEKYTAMISEGSDLKENSFCGNNM